MRVFRVSDGTSWQATLEEPPVTDQQASSGWEAILFQRGAAGGSQRLVYRPAGWLTAATAEDLETALAEGVAVRTRWGG